jgi:hypothetical protein
MSEKVLIFGMDGNIFDNYSMKAKCAGEAMSKNAKKSFNIKKSVNFFSKIYVETSGMNSLQQFKIAYEKIVDKNNVNDKILISTEKDFRLNLKKEENNIKMFPDVKSFLKNNADEFIFTITTTVPIKNITNLVNLLTLDKYFTIICARDGVWEKGKITKISGFDKGKSHYDYIRKKFKTSNLIAISSTKTDILNAIQEDIISISLEHIYDKKFLESLSPDYILKNCNGLLKLLIKI